MVDLEALDDLTEFANYWIDQHPHAGEREALRKTLHEIHEIHAQSVSNEQPRIVLARAMCNCTPVGYLPRFDDLSVERQAFWIAEADRILDQMLTHRIVPASEVPTEEQRAAVGRLATLQAAWEEWSEVRGDESYQCLCVARNAIQDGDIEAARAVAEGGQ